MDDGVYNTSTGVKTSSTADGAIDYYLPTIIAYSDYDPFGTIQDGRKGGASDYRYGFQGQEMDDEIKGEGNSVNYEYRMHDPRIGRFFAVDPLAPKYPELTPYQFSSNSPIYMVELEGLEGITIPRTMPFELFFPRIPLSIPRMPLAPSTIEIPPIILPRGGVIDIPQASAMPRIQLKVNDIDWNNPPSSPEDFGEDWEDVTDPRKAANTKNRDFRNKKTGDEITYDEGKPGAPGWEGKNHYHRHNPDRKGKGDYYLDRYGNPVAKGSKASHIEAGNSNSLVINLSPITGQYNFAVKDLEEFIVTPRIELDPTKIKSWNKYWRELKKLPNYQEIKKQYWKARWQYKKEMKEYYKEKWKHAHESGYITES